MLLVAGASIPTRTPSVLTHPEPEPGMTSGLSDWPLIQARPNPIAGPASSAMGPRVKRGPPESVAPTSVMPTLPAL
jgi:hypothetical protein